MPPAPPPASAKTGARRPAASRGASSRRGAQAARLARVAALAALALCSTAPARGQSAAPLPAAPAVSTPAPGAETPEAPSPDASASPRRPTEARAETRAETRGGPAGRFDFYVLALSWSSGFCEAGGGDERNRAQCQAGSGLGFTVHGLWPQNESGYPTECGPAGRTPSRAALERASGLYPDEGLARHQWRRHGTCSGKSPSDYFDDVRAARDKVTVPEPLRAPGAAQTWSPIDIERAFVAANRGLRPDMMAVACRRGVLSEVRVCVSRDLREFRPCPEVDRNSCRVREVRVPAVR